MKKIEVYIRDHKFEDVKNALIRAGVSGITAYPVLGRGNQIGKGVADFKSEIITEDILIPKRKIEIFCIEEELDKILETIMTRASTGEVGDGKIFVSDISEVIKIRTQERVKYKA
ncbi:MAG TPA: P-II family nitrogen regulator [Nitrosopumilaceae archaeon]|nr:P-II family nitrogen regulator [Nitrosopumilaceae archaeon]